MADLATFPTVTDVLYSGDNIGSFTAGVAISAGQVVGFVATGVDFTVRPLNATAGDMVVGVALYSASANTKVAVAMGGCIVKVQNFDDTTAIDAGHWVEVNDAAALGTVNESLITASGGATATLNPNVVGFLLSDMAGNGTAYCFLAPQTITRPNSS